MIIRVGGERLNLMRLAPLRRRTQCTPLTSSRIEHSSTQDGRAPRSKRIVRMRRGS
jgi:hypothetical protein